MVAMSLVAMPMTKTGMPPVATAPTAAMAAASSPAFWPPTAAQFGMPSVARMMYLGFPSARPVKYVPAAITAARVGGLDPGMLAGIAAVMAAGVAGTRGTPTPRWAVPPALAVQKNFKPQFPWFWVVMAT